jgi:hypothetical protein
MIFNLVDADYRLVNGQVQPKALGWAKFWREVEVYPLVHLHSRWLGELFFMFFHPVQAFKEWRGRLLYKINRFSKGNSQ